MVSVNIPFTNKLHTHTFELSLALTRTRTRTRTLSHTVMGGGRLRPNVGDHPYSRPQPSPQQILQSFLLPISSSFSSSPFVHFLRCESHAERMRG